MDTTSTVTSVLLALLFGFFVFRSLPTAIDRIKNGPKGSSSEWLNAALLLGAVAAFVLFLMSIA